MFFFKEYSPHPALHDFIRHYWIIHIQFDPRILNQSPSPKPYPPNTEQCLYFYPFDLPHSVPIGSETALSAASSNIVGQQLTRQNITINPNYLMLKVSFHPGALFRLLGVPMYLLADGVADLESITSHTLKEVNERLPEAISYADMIQLVETFLLKKAAQCQRDALPIDWVARQMLRSSAYHQLDRLAHDACLSPRQFERKFRERVGVSPKLFTRIARFGQAYKLREASPDRSWADIAYACDYYDPNHLVKDFQQFAGTTPSQLFADELALQQFFSACEQASLRE
ncbi:MULTISPECIES: helix-turn-helix domain-containing protein [unclassified Spirosoma]|uniref:helix-turn-helix domain-containing protein n=1 Tax=unclassified Spirosoma TaxID=2621999 RepID=UPI00095A6CCB|nr:MULTISPECIES: helix-turn-helix domain-containing protein [unclassified Spirosoma]MBN8821814.1 AraC family transcriptional regulator [Spirosoma sp.]OJW80697.1 MAG: AraC family transcriptional regulator [Spirosoma sp. 48-14]